MKKMLSWDLEIATSGTSLVNIHILRRSWGMFTGFYKFPLKCSGFRTGWALSTENHGPHGRHPNKRKSCAKYLQWVQMNSVVGYANYQEYKAVKAAKDAIKLMNKLARFLQTISLSSKRNQVMAPNGTNARRLFPRKDAVFQQNKSKRERSFVRFLCQTATIVHLSFGHWKKLSLNLFPNYWNSILSV